MANVENPSPTAIEVLRKIHQRGLTVLWRYHAPYPEYDDGSYMDAEDWWVVERELEGIEEKTDFIARNTTTWRTKKLAAGNTVGKVRYVVLPDGRERPVDGDNMLFMIEKARWDREQGSGVAPFQVMDAETGQPPEVQVLEVVAEEIETDGNYVSYNVRVSNWLNTKQVSNDEFEGVRYRYILTEKALALIGEGRA